MFRTLCLAVFLTSAACSSVVAQSNVADKIIAIVGKNRIVLQSELERDTRQMMLQDSSLTLADARCNLLNQMVMARMLVEQAERDSVLVSDDQVENALDNQMRSYIRMYGGKARLEEATGKTVYQLKDDYRDIYSDKLMAEQMQDKILRNVKITPGEVQVFYDQQSQDSLPFFPATLEAGQIVIEPKATAELDSYAHNRMDTLRAQIVSGGRDFETMAGIYSEDPGSRDNGGLIAGVTREGFAPEFVQAAFKLKVGEISPVVKTQFGYHIIQMIARKSPDEVDVRHILIVPTITNVDLGVALKRLDTVRAELISGKLSFSEAVGKYSNDDASKMTGGMIADPQTGGTTLQVDQLDPAMALMMDSMQVGQYSQPQTFRTERGGISTRIVYLRTRTAPHKANLRDDYGRIQAVALGNKKQQKLQSWLAEKIPTYYIRIDPAYQICPTLKPWVDRMNAQAAMGSGK